MSSCSASNCFNHAHKGYRLFRFPRDIERRKIWRQNCRTDDKWEPTDNSKICEAHFDDSQFEQHRADKWKKLKPNAVPTIFNFIDQSQVIKEIKNELPSVDDQFEIENIEIEMDSSSEHDPLEPQIIVNVNEASTRKDNAVKQNKKILKENEKYRDEISKLHHHVEFMTNSIHEINAELEKELEAVKQQHDKKEEELKKFLNDDQLQFFSKSKMKVWNSETIIKGWKFRYLLGIHGYNYLTESGYPLPSYSTLNRRLGLFNVSPGILTDFLKPLKIKASCMDIEDRLCSISVDKIAIHTEEDFGLHITLGENTYESATHLLLVLIRGIRANWKQVIGSHFISSNTTEVEVVTFLHQCIEFAEQCDLTVLSFLSGTDDLDIGVRNELGIFVNEDGSVGNMFQSNDHFVYAVPDARNSLINLKNAFLTENIHLPNHLEEIEGLPTSEVSAVFVKSLWKRELRLNEKIRTIHHLKKEDIKPSEFDETKVISATRLFSDETAASIRLAVRYKILPKNAITTAWFIELISDWYKIFSAKKKVNAITKRNKDGKIGFLVKFISIFKHLKIGEENLWKWLNASVILSSTSICDISELLLANKGFKYLLTSHFHQDAIKNCLFQIKEQAKPIMNMEKCLEAVKSISLRQYVSDVRRPNSHDNAELYLLDYYSQNYINENRTSKEFLQHQNDDHLSPDFRFPTFMISTRRWVPNEHELNLLTSACESTLNALSKANICDHCRHFCINNVNFNFYTDHFKKRGVTVPNISIVTLIINMEVIFKKYYRYILHNDVRQLTQSIVNDLNISFPRCCIDMKSFIVTHFLKIRCFINVSTSTLSHVPKKRKQEGESPAKRIRID